MNQTANILQNASDEKLMMHIGMGETKALEVLYERYFQRLCAFAFSAFNLPDVEDLVQDIFIKIIEKPDSFNADFRFQTWIFTMLANRCKNHKRNAVNRDLKARIFYISSPVFQEHENLDAAQITKEFQLVWNKLNEKEKSIYLLKYKHDFTHNEIGEILEIPTGSVKSGLFNILKKMARQLQPHITP